MGQFIVNHFDKEGQQLWGDVCNNSLADEGERDMLDLFFRGGTAPDSFELVLVNATPVDTSTVAGLQASEPSGSGYARQAIARNSVDWPTLALDTGDYMATSKTVTFEATGAGWGPVTHTTLIGVFGLERHLIAYAALSQSRTLADGETLSVIYKVKQQ